MTITSYAQNFEDVILWRTLGEFGPGCYIDIGAQDPLIDSVSQLFYEKGWRGIHIEASPQYAEKLRLARPDEQVIEAAVDSEPGELLFYRFDETGLSTGNPEVAALHRKAGYTCSEIRVPRISLDEVFLSMADGSEPLWLKIDVEGMEKSVLASWRESSIRPWVVVVESTLPGSKTEAFQGWESLIIKKGYQFVYFDGVNRFYLHQSRLELSTLLSTPPNVFDHFSLSGTASNSFSDHWKAQLHEETVQRHDTLARLNHANQEIARLREEQARYQEESADLEKQLLVLEQKYEEVHRHRQEAMAALDRVLSSTAWKLTYPFRFSLDLGKRAFGQVHGLNRAEILRRTRRLISRVIFRLANQVASSPVLKGLAIKLLRRFPSLHEWIIYQVKSRPASAPRAGLDPSAQTMTARSRRFAQLLEIENREEA
ncbi:FkbM family methyltransferase [Marinobacterium litorale]|uniref:FkbM family methyltransferase n=1 Tax=Marinobacterium litorale TaxID=404770 RepID=UPI000418E04B|nr:FkbM family methyltransferase [Marinobacterium litorale]